MASVRALEFPLHESFFPQVVLNADEIKYYKRLGKERLAQLMRIAEDADYAYKWTETRTKHGTPVQKTQFLDFRPQTKATYASILIKSSVLIHDTRPEEVLQAVAKTKTKDYRKMMKNLHGNAFVDGRTLFKFPSSIAAQRPEYSYRAIKWCTFRGKGRDESKSLDFSFLEYAGKKKLSPGSMVVGFCVQESIQREREVPLLEAFGIVRGYMSRSGIIISRTHQPNALRVTSICQIDGDIEPIVRSVLEDIMQECVGAISRLRNVIDRQRVSGLKMLEQWEWVSNSDRKACAVCVKGFFFHRKHHCRACGEVVCSSCAPLRDLDEPVFDMNQVRVCSKCMTDPRRQKPASDSNNGRLLAETLTSNDDSDALNESHGPKQNGSSEDRMFSERENLDRVRRPSDAAALLLDSNNRSTPKSKRRLTSFLKNPRETVATLSSLVDQIRVARDTINITISEAGDSRMSFGEDDAYDDLYNRVTKLRETVEMSVEQEGASSGGNSSARKPERTSPVPGITPGAVSDDDESASPDDQSVDGYKLPYEQIEDITRMTFEAAAATRHAGKKVLSSCASDLDDSEPEEYHNVREALSEDSSVAGFSDSDTSKDPYSNVGYGRMMAQYGSDRDSTDTSNDDDFGHPMPLRPVSRSHVRQLEKKIEVLQRNLLDAHRKLSFFEVEPEPEFGNALDVVHEEPFYSDEEDLVFRPDMTSRSADRVSKSSRGSGGRRDAKTRPKSDSFLRGNMPARHSLDASAIRRRDADLPAERPSLPAMTSRAATHGRSLSTADMLNELYGVMNSSETTKPALPPRKTSMSRVTSSPPLLRLPSTKTAVVSVQPSENRTRAPPPPPPVSAKTMYVDDDGQLLPGAPSSEDSPHDNGLDKTASSSASYLMGASQGSSTGLQKSGVVSRDRSLSSPAFAKYQRGNSLNPAGSSSSSAYSSSSSSSQERDDARDNQAFFGQTDSSHAFFGQQMFPKSTAQNALPPVPRGQTRRGSIMAMPRQSSGMRFGGRDESSELRDMMEDLVRPRSNSVPFRTRGQEELGRPTFSDGASVHHPAAPQPRQTETALAEVRACLAALNRECPSEWERHRKLQSIARIFQSLVRDGVRSKFRTLNHEDIRYDKVLEETPSVVKLLKLAGYVSLPQKLTMRRVDIEYIGVFLREVEAELSRMQATQDYL
ncbi:hypothetical protein PINS_up003449 [Pythium insidiosum]|nr:hypothetical protein PINS_up003449 [Pythium insidiosum]